MKKIFTLFAAVVLAAIGLQVNGQIITTSPALLQESSSNVVLTYHADSPLGNDGLKGLASSVAVYAHIGVITNKSTSVSDWKYAPTWGDNAAKYKLTYKSANTYELNIGNLRTYFGITDANEKIEKIACVFRTGDKTKEGKTKSGGDIFVDILEPGFQIRLIHDGTSNVLQAATTLKFTIDVTNAADVTLKVNNTAVSTTKVSSTQYTASYNFSALGSYNVVATAVYGGKTYTSTIDIVYPKASQSRSYPGGTPKMGPVENSDGTVTFCIAVPKNTKGVYKKSVILVPEWDDYKILDKNTMYYQDYQGQRYYWLKVSGIRDGKDHGYYFLVDGELKVGDPYAKLALDPYSDKWLDQTIWPDMPKYPYDKFSDTMVSVYNSAQDNYNFSDFTIPDSKQLVIYELLLRDFTGDEGEANGNGTIKKAMAKLPYLKKLGVNAIELMPVMEFNGNGSWGYNTNFYMAPDKAYGSPKDLKDFIEQAHKMGMAIILDIVLNQSDGLHPWYQLYEISENPFYNEKAPHDYSVLNDWNQDNALVKQYWKDVLQYWMTAYNVDGYRFDLVKGLGSNSSYASGTEAYNSSRVANMKTLHSHIKAIKPNGIHINENLAGAQEENEMAADGQLNWANCSYGSSQYAMGVGSGSNQTYKYYSEHDSRTWGSTVSYAESHDEERMAYKQKAFGQGDLKTSEASRYNRLGSVAAQMLLTPGPKMIWQFGELGADESTKKDDGGNNTDPKEVVWSRLDNSNAAALNHTYEMLCNLRKNNPELFAQGVTFATTGVDENVSTSRTFRVCSGNKEVIAFVNETVSGSNRSVGTTASYLRTNNYQLVCASPNFNGSLTGSGSAVSVSLPYGSYAVYATKNVVVKEGEGATPGDVDGDGKIDVNDLGSLVNIICGLASSTSGADVDGDGKVDINDLGTLVNMLCGM